MVTVLLTVIGGPANGGIVDALNARAMHPPVGVPANGGPATLAVVTRPDGANVTWTFATPLGSPGCLQPEARPTAALKAALATLRSNSPVAAAVAVGTTIGGLVVEGGTVPVEGGTVPVNAVAPVGCAVGSALDSAVGSAVGSGGDACVDAGGTVGSVVTAGAATVWVVSGRDVLSAGGVSPGERSRKKSAPPAATASPT